jgi:uncharacterized protein (TIGR03083 family)
MTLARDVVSDGLTTELGRMEALIRSLTIEQWDTPSRCAGWTVGDVARHSVGSVADATSGRLEGLGTPEATQREVDERAGRTPAQLADECAEVAHAAAGMLTMFDDEAWEAPVGSGIAGTIGFGVEALWFDTYMHADDMRSSLGHAPDLGSGAIAGSVSHVEAHLAEIGWNEPLPATGQAAYDAVMVATGRAEPSLVGAGAPPNIYA